jgi:hypothetical protein
VSRSDYYEELKELARQVRAAHDLTTPRVLRSDLNRIYKQERIQIDRWPHKLRNLRGAYFYDEECGASVMIAKK